MNLISLASRIRALERRMIGLNLVAVGATGAIALSAFLLLVNGTPRAGSSPVGPGQSIADMEVAITVDDIPLTGSLIPGMSRMDIATRLLQALKQNDVKQAYGFVNGWNDEDLPDGTEILRHWLRAGYPLGNHTFSHTNLDDVSVQAYVADIEKVDDLLATLTPVSPLIRNRRVFRYPFLEEGNTLEKRDAVRRYLKRKGYVIAETTIINDDWAWTEAYVRCVQQGKTKSAESLREHATDYAERQLYEAKLFAEQLLGRDIKQILVIHDNVFEAVTLNKVLEDLRRKGVRFVTLDEALSDPVYRVNPNVANEDFATLLHQIARSRNMDAARFESGSQVMKELAGTCAQSPAKK